MSLEFCIVVNENNTHTCSQLQSLGPLGTILPKFRQQYAILARSLDVTRNEMAVDGVLPCSEGE